MEVAIGVCNAAAKFERHMETILQGLCIYYRWFVKGFSDNAMPMHSLAEDKTPFEWSRKCQGVKENLEKVSNISPDIKLPTLRAAFIVDTNASNTGIGGVLSQIKKNEEEEVAHFNRILS